MTVIIKRQTTRNYILSTGSTQHHPRNILTKRQELNFIKILCLITKVQVIQRSYNCHLGLLECLLLGQSVLESSCHASRSSSHMENLLIVTLVDSPS